MLVATAIMILGLLVGVSASQFGALRLGGVIVVPLIAVYLLRSFGSFPLFVVSIAAAYVSLKVVTDRYLIYGRQLFLVTIVVGSLVPVTVFELFGTGFGLRDIVGEVEFLGSILPGIAAYNFHRMDDDRRVLDAVWAMAVLLFLVVAGIGLVVAVGLTPLSGVLPPVLLGPKSDIAIAFDLTVSRPTVPVIATRRFGFGLIVFGTILSEGVRRRYGLRVGGVIIVPVVVIGAFREPWTLPLWVGATAVSYVGVQILHWWTLLYGRVLLSMGVVFGLLAVTSLMTVVPVENGLLPFFVGILGGVTAYNLHVVPSAERRESVAVTVGVFVVVTAVARLFVVPPLGGFVATVTGGHIAIGVALLAPTAWVAYRHERMQPDDVTGGVGDAVPAPNSDGGGV